MPEIIETTVYRFDALSEPARETARAWYRGAGLDHDWYEFVCADCEAICAILGVELKTRTVRLFGGGLRQKPAIHFSGFWSQGDGACFEAAYRYQRHAPRRIRDHAPNDTELHRIADSLQSVQRAHFYQLRAEICHRGRYYHEFCMDIAARRDSSTGQVMMVDAEEMVIEAMRDLARWLYRQLEREYEYQTSDEVVDQIIAANGYTFTESGHEFG
jgi:hypothetical protein